MTPEMRHLRHFVAVAETLNFSRAAATVHLGQQGLSASIQQLERLLGVRLLVRDSRNVALTPAGEAFLPEARLAIGQVDRAVHRARQAAAGSGPVLRVGYVVASAAAVVPALLAQVHRRAPALLVATREGWGDDLLDQLRRGELDVVLMRFPPDDDDLDRTLVRRDEMVVALPREHRLAGRDLLDLPELAPLPLLVRPRSERYNARVREVCRRAGYEPDEVVTPVIGNPALRPVVQGRAFALVDRELVERFPEPVAVVGIHPPAPTLPLVAVRLRRRPDEHADLLGPVLRALRTDR